MTEKTIPAPATTSVAPERIAAAVTPRVAPFENPVIDRWFAEHFQQPPIAHSTDCYNQAIAARDALKQILGKS